MSRTARHAAAAASLLAWLVFVPHHRVATAAQAGAGAAPAPAPQSSNLLSFAAGTIVRSYSPGIKNVAFLADGLLDAASDPASLEDGAAGPLRIVYELPGVATLSSLKISLDAASDVTVALSTTSATDGFKDAGSVHNAGADQPLAGVSGNKARWVRIAATVSGGALPIKSIIAAGSLAPRPAGAAAPAGDFWALDEALNSGGGVRKKPEGEQPQHLEVVQLDDAINGDRCSEASFDTAYPGRLDGRNWNFHRLQWSSEEPFHGRFVVNDEGTVIAGADVGADGGVLMHAFVRAVPQTPAASLPFYCSSNKLGTGGSPVLVLSDPTWAAYYPFEDPNTAAAFKGYSFTIAAASLLTPSLLNGKDIVVLNALCSPANLFTPKQTSALVDWVQAGHKLLIEDSDECGGDEQHAPHYDFLPYKFVTDNPGGKGATGHHLVVLENNSLGSADKGDADRFVDTAAYIADPNNDLGDANTVLSQDPHWCGHLFGTNANDIDGFMQMYAVTGKGLMIYEGLDADDENIPAYRKLRALEFAQPVPGDLTCSKPVSAGFVLATDQTATFTPGTARTITVPMTVFSNRQWKGHVALAVSGDFPATLSAAAVDLPPAQRPITVTIQVPATAKSGHYAVVVKGTGGGSDSHATVTIGAQETRDILREQLAKSCKVAIYGINFDFNKTTIRKDAEPALQQVLALFTADPSLKVEIGGHTDNIGTASYNQTLSGGRAEAVKGWLVAHGVAAARLTTHGYGDTAPVVPNTTDENRARNRRVELKKPGCTD